MYRMTIITAYMDSAQCIPAINKGSIYFVQSRMAISRANMDCVLYMITISSATLEVHNDHNKGIYGRCVVQDDQS